MAFTLLGPVQIHIHEHHYTTMKQYLDITHICYIILQVYAGCIYDFVLPILWQFYCFGCLTADPNIITIYGI